MRFSIDEEQTALTPKATAIDAKELRIQYPPKKTTEIKMVDKVPKVVAGAPGNGPEPVSFSPSFHSVLYERNSPSLTQQEFRISHVYLQGEQAADDAASDDRP